MKKIIACLLAAMAVVSTAALTGCRSEQNPVTTTTRVAATTDKTEIKLPSMELSGYKIIISDKASAEIKKAANEMKSILKQYLSLEIRVANDYVYADSPVDPAAKEILVGATNRQESLDAQNKLAEVGGNKYLIEFTDNKIVIYGADDKAILFGMRAFLTEFASKSTETGAIPMPVGVSEIKDYDADMEINEYLVTIDIISKSTVQSLKPDGGSTWPTYGRIMQLKHNGENNGTLFATGQWAGKNFPIYRSTDDGKTWELISTVEETMYKKLLANWQPHIYELPCKVGEMPEGTLLLAGCSHDSSTERTTRMCIWRSYDLGLTWEEFTIVDEGNGIGDGMYEPFLICDDDGTLVCFYSDETEVSDKGGQRLVFRTSKDGVTWGDLQYCVAPSDTSLRPGMVTVTKVGDYGYALAYEMIGQERGPVYCKFSKSLTDWGNVKSYGTQVKTSDAFTGCTPYIEWTPRGGKYGTLIAAGRFGELKRGRGSDLFISFDLGKTWQSFENPLPYDYYEDSSANYAYSFGFFTGSDGDIYYINNCFPDNEANKYKYADFKVAKIRITRVGEG